MHHRRLIAAAGAAAIAATIAATSITTASAAPRAQLGVSGTEHVQVMSASPAGPATAIAYGAFTAAGQAHLGGAKLGKIIFPGGTIRISHHAGRGTSRFNPRTCLAIISQPGTYKIVGGTGKYAGISGHGKYQLSLAFIGARSKGKCSSAKPPVAQQELLRLSGPVHLNTSAPKQLRPLGQPRPTAPGGHRGLRAQPGRTTVSLGVPAGTVTVNMVRNSLRRARPGHSGAARAA